MKQRHTTVTHLVFLEIPRLPALTSCSFQWVHLWTVEHYPYKTETTDIIEVVVNAAQHAVHLAATRVCYEAPITQNAVELRTCSFARTHLHRSMLSTLTSACDVDADGRTCILNGAALGMPSEGFPSYVSVPAPTKHLNSPRIPIFRRRS